MKFENIKVYGFEEAIRGMRNSYQSWDKLDSYILDNEIIIGEKDLTLMQRLVKAGASHRKFLRMINIYVDITGPAYWWKEFDTYKIGTVANSTSTMHSIMKKEFELSDFTYSIETIDSTYFVITTDLSEIIDTLNRLRTMYLESTDQNKKEALWNAIIKILPFSYNYKRTVMFNYEVALTIYKQRKGHKLSEWKEFLEFLEDLPYWRIMED